MDNYGIRLLSVLNCVFFIAGVSAAEEVVRHQAVRFSVSVGIEATDNRDSAEDAESNTDIYFRPRLDGSAFPGSLNLLYYYQPSLRYRSDPSPIQNDTELLHDLGFSIESKPTPRQTIKLREWFTYTDDPAVTDGGREVRSDSSYIRNQADMDWFMQFTPRTGTGLMLGYILKRYSENDVADFYDEDRLSFNVRLRHRIARDTALSGVVGYDSYSREPVMGAERSFNTITYSGVIDHRMGTNLRVEGRAGMQTADYKDDEIDSASSPYFNLAAIMNLSPDTQLTLQLNRSIWNGYTFPYASQDHSHINMALDWSAPARWRVNVFGEYRLDEYERDKVPAGTGFSGEDGEKTTWLARAAVTYSFNNQLSLTVSQQYEDVDSDVDASFTRNATALYLTHAF